MPLALSMADNDKVFNQEAFISESHKMRLNLLEEQAMFALKIAAENDGNAVFPNTAPGLPESYLRALKELGANATAAADGSPSPPACHPDPRALSDEERLSLGREMLSNFYDTKDAWSTIGGWAAEEGRLLGLGGRAAEAQAAAAGCAMASVVMTPSETVSFPG